MFVHGVVVDSERPTRQEGKSLLDTKMPFPVFIPSKGRPLTANLNYEAARGGLVHVRDQMHAPWTFTSSPKLASHACFLR